MIGLNHVLTGSVIGLAVQEPLLVVPIAFLSHFVLDAIPHFGGVPAYKYGHKHFVKIMAVDGFLCLAAFFTVCSLAPHLILPIALGGFFAALPDVFWLHRYATNNKSHWFHHFHKKIQWFERPPGAFVEASYCILACTVITALTWGK